MQCAQGEYKNSPGLCSRSAQVVFLDHSLAVTSIIIEKPTRNLLQDCLHHDELKLPVYFLHNTLQNFPHIHVQCSAKNQNNKKTLFICEATSAHVVYKLKDRYDISKHSFHTPMSKLTVEIM